MLFHLDEGGGLVVTVERLAPGQHQLLHQGGEGGESRGGRGVEQGGARRGQRSGEGQLSPGELLIPCQVSWLLSTCINLLFLCVSLSTWWGFVCDPFIVCGLVCNYIIYYIISASIDVNTFFFIHCIKSLISS